MEQYDPDSVIHIAQSENHLVPSSRLFHNITAPNPHFSGRTKELQRLTAYLNEKKERTILINGLGGVGKTELVREFGKRLKEAQVANCVWLRGEDESTLLDSIIKLAEKFQIDIKSNNEDVLQIVEQILSHLTDSSHTKETWFIVIDNSDNKEIVEKLVQPLIKLIQRYDMFVTIVTSRLPGALDGDGVNFELRPWTPEEACNFIRDNLENPGEDKSVQLLCETFDNLPLALELARTLISKKRATGLKGYSYGIDDLLPELKLDKERQTKDGKTVWDKLESLWKISIDSLRREEPYGLAATELMCCIGYLDPDSIAVKTLVKILHSSPLKAETEQASLVDRFCNKLYSIFKTPFNPTHPMQSLWHKSSSMDDYKNLVENSLELLKSYSLIRVEDFEVSVHRLFQEVIRRQFVVQCSAPSPKQPLEILASGASVELSESKVFDKDTLRQSSRIWNHLKDHDKWIVQFKSMPWNLRKWMLQLGLQTQILQFLRANEDKMRSLLTPTDKDLILFLKALANAYQINEDWDKAKEMLQTLVPLMENVFGKDDEETILTKLYFAAVLRHDKKIDEAFELTTDQLKRAQSVAEKNGEIETTLTIKIKQKLAHIYGRRGDFALERETLEKIIQWREEQYNNRHHEDGEITDEIVSILRTKQNLGCCLMRLGKYGEAKAIFALVYAKRERLLTEEHASTLNTKQDLAEAILQDGESTEDEKTLAISYLREILPLKIKVHGETHKRVQLARDALSKWDKQLL